MNQKTTTKFPFKPFSRYCLRTPLIPYNFFVELTAEDVISDKIFKENLQNPIVAEALFLASPDFYVQVKKWERGDVASLDKVSRIKLSLTKYLTRIATRCTPFGLFAGVSAGSLGNQNKVEPESFMKHRRKTHYDMHFLVAFSDFLVSQPHIRSQLTFHPNSTLYRIGNRFRYIEYQYKDKRRVHSLESVLHSNYLELIIEKARPGASLIQLTTLLVNKDINLEDATKFINELVDNQILLSELEPTVCGPDYLYVLESKLSTMKKTKNELHLIKKIREALNELDKKIGNPVEDYLTIENQISTFGVPFEIKYLFQTDTFTKMAADTVKMNIARKVSQGMAFLNKISSSVDSSSLEQFKKSFLRRYEHERVPLLTVLDIETGIGYVQNPSSLDATPFLDDVVQPEKVVNENVLEIDWSPLQRVLHSKLVRSKLGKKPHTINLKDEDFPDQEYNWEGAPDTISAMVEIVEEVGVYKIAMNHFGPNAGSLIARFCHGDKELAGLVKNIAEKEKQIHPDKIIAEIIHLPESRTGNILRRPSVRNYEIPCLGKSNLPLKKQIPLDDILVTVSQNKIKLISKKHDREVLPKLTNAHNYNSNALPAYHFLCDLQYQNSRSYSFKWGALFYEHLYLPRIEYKDCILAKATWNLRRKDLKPIEELLKIEKIKMAKVDRWREELRLPEIAQLVDGDNTLVVNFKNYTSVSMFLTTIKNREGFRLEEFLFENDCLVKNKEGRYCNQFVFAFYNDQKLQKAI